MLCCCWKTPLYICERTRRKKKLILDHIDKNSFDPADLLKVPWSLLELTDDTRRTAIVREKCYYFFPVDKEAVTQEETWWVGTRLWCLLPTNSVGFFWLGLYGASLSGCITFRSSHIDNRADAYADVKKRRNCKNNQSMQYVEADCIPV